MLLRDWFDENDQAALQLINQLRTAHLEYVRSRESSSKKCHYLEIRRITQDKLRDMKNKWWDKMACELQEAADQHDMKRFYKNLRSVYGSKVSGFAPVKDTDGMTLLTTRKAVLQRWADHFNLMLNQPSSFDSSVINDLPQSPLVSRLDASPTLVEV